MAREAQCPDCDTWAEIVVRNDAEPPGSWRWRQRHKCDVASIAFVINCRLCFNVRVCGCVVRKPPPQLQSKHRCVDALTGAVL